jgi:ubiquinone/menaquinone biosynthesis C-methylase UbiE
VVSRPLAATASCAEDSIHNYCQYLVGPGVGIHALPIASALGPSARLDVLDVQPAMLEGLMARAHGAGLHNIHPATGDAARLPYPDHSFDAAYLVSVLGEVPDAPAAVRELRRVLKPGGRLVVGEIIADPDFISVAALRQRLGSAGFEFERRLAPGLAYFASFVSAV